MWIGFGIACVAWTSLELARLLNGAHAGPRLDAPPQPRHAGRSTGHARRRPEAWDDRGQRIVVDDLGRL